MSYLKEILNSPIEYLKGVGPARAELLQQELSIFRVRDLLYQFPFRYIDKTTFQKISEITEDGTKAQFKGKIVYFEKIGGSKKTRLVANFKDPSGFMDLIWFQRVKSIENKLETNKEYIIYGTVKIYKGIKSIIHPEVEEVIPDASDTETKMEAVYPSTEKLNARYMGGKFRRTLIANIFKRIGDAKFQETLPVEIIKNLELCSRHESLHWIHSPQSHEQQIKATNRLKFEELFLIQLRMLKGKIDRQNKFAGAVFSKIGDYFNTFFHDKLPFELTGAQKRVLKEIRADLNNGRQMNRLLQGDVGSGKTIVALMTMLIALDNGFQACLMAPTEILARQHLASISEQVEGTGVVVDFLSGSVKGKKRKKLFEALAAGEIHILIGTHALIEDPVKFKNLGLAITDEQHRFGVAQRAKLWNKNDKYPPHILVMTATPIPRTLAMTAYGDLDVSVIDELPPGRKDIKTVHKYDTKRAEVILFMRSEIEKGRQIYIVFPLIEESAKMDLKNLQAGYERLLPHFPKPKYQISVVHGRMKSDEKEWEMQRFVEKTSQIMVATTVIEVGVNVPNASVMIIENANRFGLSQLHQLRGRVGRGADQSYCVLMSDHKLSKGAREKIKIMCQTNNGFEISEADLRLRGHGNIEGTQQSGTLNFKIADIIQDQDILSTARDIAMETLRKDPDLSLPEHNVLRQLAARSNRSLTWGRIS